MLFTSGEAQTDCQVPPRHDRCLPPSAAGPCPAPTIGSFLLGGGLGEEQAQSVSVSAAITMSDNGSEVSQDETLANPE